VKQTGYFGECFGYRRDCAIGGAPLRLGGRTYEKGLCLHARCELTYEIIGGAKLLLARAGIDDGARFGAAHLTIRGDGRPLLERQRLEYGQPARTLRVSLAGVKKLTILADFDGRRCGAGEWVSLVEAVLLR
jgi:hypothetical protein